MEKDNYFSKKIAKAFKKAGIPCLGKIEIKIDPKLTKDVGKFVEKIEKANKSSSRCNTIFRKNCPHPSGSFLNSFFLLKLK